MSEDWGELVKRYRLRHGLTQGRMATVIGVSQRTVSRWERGDDKPSLDLQRKLRDMGWEPPGTLLASLAQSVRALPIPARPVAHAQAAAAGALGPGDQEAPFGGGLDRPRSRAHRLRHPGGDAGRPGPAKEHRRQGDRLHPDDDPQRAAHEGAPADRDLSHRDHLLLPRGHALQRRDLHTGAADAALGYRAIAMDEVV